MSLKALIDASRRYGRDPHLVLLGGGNTSCKEGNILYVKASGHALGSIDEDGFVRMDRSKLEEIWNRTFSSDDARREEEVLDAMMASRLEGERARPSVEALLHALLPFTYVVHLHPSLVNGLTCAVEGEKYCKKLFPEALWIGLVKPGFILADTVRRAMMPLKETPNLIILQNHGIFAGAESLEEIDELYRHVLSTLKSNLKRDVDEKPVTIGPAILDPIKEELEPLFTEEVAYFHSNDTRSLLGGEESFYPISSSFTPDHIVYSGFKPLFVPAGDSITEAFEAFGRKHGQNPKVVCVQDAGVFADGEKPLALFIDTVRISVYSESFGGPLFMTDEMIEFIRNWEVEQYRAKVPSQVSLDTRRTENMKRRKQR
ncbi:MAG: class II aldolase [Spirochaetales bacterium]|nr:class II aldolase [Spirochaetales bacterium]